jgi:oxygen-independent coproporphyrinogen III oxidase
MAGIYFHIPWCRKVCIYCDFHFSVSMRNKSALLDCMIREMELQKDYLDDESIESVYFGGGTPSVLSPGDINRIIDHIPRFFNISNRPEVTLEANPDDMSLTYLAELKSSGINRLSIGIQSFFDDDLEWMNRRHDRNGSLNSIEFSKKAGFGNISIDLIYGLPEMSMEKWMDNLNAAFKSKVQHISAYHLTLEDKTVYSWKVKKGLLREPDETAGMEQFKMLMDLAGKEGFIHYEISNFCLPGFQSRHNSSYWQQKPYLGIGPSANSFNRTSRQWNIRNNNKYIEEISNGRVPCTNEQLGPNELYNEYILTSLRTMWGVDINRIREDFGPDLYDTFIDRSRKFLEDGRLEQNGNRITISDKAKFFADGIISDFFAV